MQVFVSMRAVWVDHRGNSHSHSSKQLWSELRQCEFRRLSPDLLGAGTGGPSSMSSCDWFRLSTSLSFWKDADCARRASLLRWMWMLSQTSPRIMKIPRMLPNMMASSFSLLNLSNSDAESSELLSSRLELSPRSMSVSRTNLLAAFMIVESCVGAMVLEW